MYFFRGKPREEKERSKKFWPSKFSICSLLELAKFLFLCYILFLWKQGGNREMELSNWDFYWAGDQEKDYWQKPDPAVLELIENHPAGQFPRVLDLGCGPGRHALAFARGGYRVTAVDASKMALVQVEERAREKRLKLETILGDFRTTLFAPETFDLVICYNVVYHGLREEMVRGINQCQQYLRPGGLLFLTCPTRDDGKYGDGEEVAPHTFRSGEKSVHPGDLHYFSDCQDLECFFAGLEIMSRKKKEHYWKQDGIVNFSSYWQLIAKKK